MQDKPVTHRLMVIVETPMESVIKDAWMGLMLVGACLALRWMEFADSFMAGVFAAMLGLLMLTALIRLGVVPHARTISAPPAKVGEIIDGWLEETADDEE